jgi:hypothetical protein
MDRVLVVVISAEMGKYVRVRAPSMCDFQTMNKGNASLLVCHLTCFKSGHIAWASRFVDTSISIGEPAMTVSLRLPDGLSERLDKIAKCMGREKGEAQFYIPVGKAAVDSVLASLGLDRLRAKADAAKLDGLLVLWRAGL